MAAIKEYLLYSQSIFKTTFTMTKEKLSSCQSDSDNDVLAAVDYILEEQEVDFYEKRDLTASQTVDKVSLKGWMISHCLLPYVFRRNNMVFNSKDQS